jgi:cell division protein ZapA (FtsZ GTPase activity inhibitor)
MDNDTLVKIILGSFGLVLLALNIIKDMAKSKSGSGSLNEKDLKAEREKALEPVLAAVSNLKDNIDAVALLIKEISSGALTRADAENLLAIKARDQHEAFFKQIPSYGRGRCADTVRAVIKDIESDLERQNQYISDQLAAIITTLSKLYGAKTGRHTEPAITPHVR